KDLLRSAVARLRSAHRQLVELGHRQSPSLHEREARRFPGPVLWPKAMNFELSDVQRDIPKLCRDLARNELTPHARKWDEQHAWPESGVKKLAELALLGVAVPEKYGGAGLDNVCYALAIEEISRGCASTGVIMSVNNSLYCDPVMKFGTEEQKAEFL